MRRDSSHGITGILYVHVPLWTAPDVSPSGTSFYSEDQASRPQYHCQYEYSVDLTTWSRARGQPAHRRRSGVVASTEEGDLYAASPCVHVHPGIHGHAGGRSAPKADARRPLYPRWRPVVAWGNRDFSQYCYVGRYRTRYGGGGSETLPLPRTPTLQRPLCGHQEPDAIIFLADLGLFSRSSAITFVAMAHIP